VDIQDQTPGAGGSNPDSAQMPARTLLINNDVLHLLSGPVGGQVEATIDMCYLDGSGDGGHVNFIVQDAVYVTNYNGIAGDNFQVFYMQQAAGFIVPQSTSDNYTTIGSPEAGLTNAQTWAKYGIAIAGAVAPSTATTMSGIVGLVQPD
jgi:hypothetical protein